MLISYFTNKYRTTQMIHFNPGDKIYLDDEHSRFHQAYTNQPNIISGIRGIFSSENITMQSGGILLRMMLNITQPKQKYVICIQFNDLGDNAIINLISMYSSRHKNIVKQFYDKLETTLLENFYDIDFHGILLRSMSDNQTNQWKIFNHYEEWPICHQVMIAGGEMIFSNNNISFTGESTDFTDKIFGVNANELATEIYRIINLKDDLGQVPNSTSSAFEQLQDWLKLLDESQGVDGFYEKFATSCPCPGVTSQQTKALCNMKVNDRIIYGGDDPTQASIEELNTGLCKYIENLFQTRFISRSN